LTFDLDKLLYPESGYASEPFNPEVDKVGMLQNH